MNIEPELRHYSGELGKSGESYALSMDGAGWRELIRKQWPDVRLPAKIIIMPLEDYEIITSDLAGQVITPHRDAVSITIPPPEPEPRAASAMPPIWWALFLGAVGAAVFLALAHALHPLIS